MASRFRSVTATIITLMRPTGTRPRRHWTLPRTLPKSRIDIRQLAPAKQPRAWRFFSLPLELRQLIYEQLLGGRVAYLRCVPVRHTAVTRATFFQPVDHPNDDPQRLDTSAERVSTAVLLACRQIYLEAQPILYQRNTFYVSVHNLEMAILTGLGEFCLPNIRSLYLYHNYRTTYIPPWATVFPRLQQMRLTHLVFEFEIYGASWDRWTAHNPRVDVLNDTWARSVFSIRTLSQFGLFIKDLSLQDVNKPIVHSADVAEEFRKLMIGSRAEESYRDYLEKWDETRIKHIPSPYLHV
ncbi:hypothetical protein B0H14DRAFT_2835708 [Mycena olivaceomarginata]|nr:hypothetical protein B0H14DRAFT_2835708 [Mycena olivaceomarginata]